MRRRGGQRLDHHRNAFGCLRLILASLVIASHAPEVLDGDRGREFLTCAFGTLSFGELAVDGFFILSGYLVSASYLAAPEIGRYLLKRVVRIYPAFIVASLICVLLVAPLGGADLRSPSLASYASALGRSLALDPPRNPGAFAGTYYPDLDGAMWTISYEFRCYLLVLLVGVTGLLRRPLVLAASALGLVVASAYVSGGPEFLPARYDAALWLGTPDQMCRLAGMCLAGATFRALCHEIRFGTGPMLAAAGVVTGCLCVPKLASLGVATAGAYLLFGASTLGRGTVLERINNDDDISYGVYLYAWPVEKLLIAGGMTMLVPLALATWLAAMVLGAASWFLIERPALRFMQGWRRQPAMAGGVEVGGAAVALAGVGRARRFSAFTAAPARSAPSA